VTVHLVHPDHHAARGLQAGQQADQVPPGGAAHGYPASEQAVRTARQQRRHERGAERAARRKQGGKTPPHEEKVGSPNSSQGGEEHSRACTLPPHASASVGTTLAADTPPPQAAPSPPEAMEVVPGARGDSSEARQAQLEPSVARGLPDGAGREKRAADASPHKALGSEPLSPSSEARIQPKRLAAPTPVGEASGAPLQKTTPTECRSGSTSTMPPQVSPSTRVPRTNANEQQVSPSTRVPSTNASEHPGYGAYSPRSPPRGPPPWVTRGGPPPRDVERPREANLDFWRKEAASW
jgi:hypothetical protein